MTRPLGRGGLEVPSMSLGMAPAGNFGRALTDDEWAGSLATAWDAGVRYFDTAPHYGLGLSERRLGQDLRPDRWKDAIVSTKVGRLLVPADNPTGAPDDEGFAVPADLVRVRDYSRDGVRRSLEESLVRLGLDRVDILLVHDPDDHYREALDGAFPALEELRSEGVIRSYGAGMNQTEMLTRFVRHTDLDVVLVAGRYTLLDQQGLDEMLPTCQERHVSVVAAGVFNSGILAIDRPTQGATYNYTEAPAELISKTNRIAAICERHGVTLPAVAAQFPLGHPAVSTVLLGAQSSAQITRNAGLFDVEIPSDLWAELVAEGLLATGAPVPTSPIPVVPPA
jgi:D-threo-aldose 1-dehydrogenase